MRLITDLRIIKMLLLDKNIRLNAQLNNDDITKMQVHI